MERIREVNKMSEERECLGRLFKQIHLAFKMRGSELMKSVEVTPAQMDIMLLLNTKERNGSEVTQRDIETDLRLSNPTVTGLLNRMEEKGFIRRVRKETDKRCRFIYMTEQGRTNMEMLERARRQGEAYIVKGMTDRQVEELGRLLKIVLSNLTEQESLQD